MNMELSKDEKTLIIQIPMKFQKRGGRKLIFAPDGRQMDGPLRSNRDDVLLNALADAHKWKRMLDSGQYDSITQLAEEEGTDRANMSRMLTLTLLAPDIVDSILDGTQSDRLNISVLKKGFPVDWGEQREWFGFL
jgi:hypothetical protein